MKKQKEKPNPVPWPFPEWKDGKMVVKKLRVPTKRDVLRYEEPAPF